MSATGGTAPYQFTVTSGAAPNGLTLAASGALTGLPTLAGNFNFTVTATDANNCTGARAYTLTITCPAVTVNPATLAPRYFGLPYTQNFSATGGTGPYSFAISTGALPAGLSLSPAGVLTGAAFALGTFTFNVRATDANGCQGARAYTLTLRYDGDGKADIAVWRRSGTWFVKRSSNGSFLIQNQGQSGDVPVPAQGVR
ncbi:MAG: putative Ig domain-containing protein [Acidobacteria bacterium]|nr:putative Ig domain-containing protein [Acidobacteriota bacterium]MBI3426702.1 putative Ig domain-containing protein [Acidobacteriota bacterium]